MPLAKPKQRRGYEPTPSGQAEYLLDLADRIQAVPNDRGRASLLGTSLVQRKRELGNTSRYELSRCSIYYGKRMGQPGDV